MQKTAPDHKTKSPQQFVSLIQNDVRAPAKANMRGGSKWDCTRNFNPLTLDEGKDLISQPEPKLAAGTTRSAWLGGMPFRGDTVKMESVDKRMEA